MDSDKQQDSGFSKMYVYQAVLLTLIICYPALISAADRPNIVLIVADDLGWDDVGFHGSEIKTPNLDRLAYEGVILNNYYVSPICTPTRGSLMTGRHPIHLGLQHGVIRADTPYGLPLNHSIMAEHMKHLGYNTHIVGKWHLGFFKTEYLPTNRGFDSHYGYWAGKEDYFNHIDIDGYAGLDFRANMTVVNVTHYSTELYTAEAQRVINNHDTNKPLFLYLAYQAVHAGNGHDPLQAPQKYVDRFSYITNKKRRIFAGMVSALDDSIGQVVETLDQRGMLDNTIIVFTTDNGGPAHNYDGNAACNIPLRGLKNTLWEGGVHGVGFVHSKLLKTPGTKSNNMIHVSDWLPTLYSAAGGPLSDLGDIDGMDLWHMIQNNGSNIRKEILHNIDPISKFSAIRVGDFKLIQGDISGGRNDEWYSCNPPAETSGNISVKTLGKRSVGEYVVEYEIDVETEDEPGISNIMPNLPKDSSKLRDNPYIVKCGERPPDYKTNCKPMKAPCLFNIATDPCEYRNVADLYPSVVQDLLKRINELSKTAVKPVNKPSDKNANPELHGGVWVPWQGS